MPAPASPAWDTVSRPPLPPAWLVLASLIMEGRPDQVRAARQFISQALGAEHPRADEALLLGSELVTNAVVHSRSGLPGGTVLVVVARSPGAVQVLVTDEGSADREPRVGSLPGAEHGNGLLLVEALADGWGYLSGAAFTTVWFCLRAAPGYASSGAPACQGSRTPP